MSAAHASLHLAVQVFDNGKHMAHSGMNASALYLFDRIFSLAQVSASMPVQSQRKHLFYAPCLHFIYHRPSP